MNKPQVVKQPFGMTGDGVPVDLFTLKNQNGVQMEITNYGGRIVSLLVPDRHNQMDDVVLGFSMLPAYLAPNPYFGAIIGRCANRTTVEGSINGKNIQLSQNHPKYHIHGGFRGFDKVVWQGTTAVEGQTCMLKLAYRSLDGVEGYPGNLDTVFTYTLQKDNTLRIHYSAVSDQDTVVNLTNHAYFNLRGAGNGNVLDHELTIDADAIVEIDSDSIPTGKLLPVEDTRFDFRRPQPIGGRPFPGKDGYRHVGYDQNWVLNTSPVALENQVCLFDPVSGRTLQLATTMPGVQVYTANTIGLSTELIGKRGCKYGPYSGICLETQFFPDAIHHAHFPSPILAKGAHYQHETVYRFST